MEQIEQQVRTKFRFVKEKNLTVDNKHKEIGLFSISEKSLSVGIGGDSYIYLPSIETLNENFVSKIAYTRDMISKADVEMVYSKSEVDDKIAQAIAGSVVDLSDYYNKSEVDDKLLLKADLSLVYTKTDVDDLIALIPNFDSSLYYNKSDIDGKLALKLDINTYNSDKVNYVLRSDLVNYYLKGDIDSKLDKKVNVVDYKADKLTFATKDELNLKLDASTYNSDKTTFATKLELANKADDSKIGDLQNTGLTGSTVTELLTDAKTKIGNIDLTNYYTKSETYKKDEIDGKVDVKLDASTYNSDKLAYALKTDLSDINVKLEKLNNSIRPVLSLTEDTAAVEGQLDKQAWLTQKLKTKKQLDPENGLVITTSDGDSYFYFDGQWTLKKTYKVSHVTDTVMGIVQSKSDKGYGYIKASPSNDGTMVLTDYRDILDAIDLKADDSDLTTLSGKVTTLEGTVSQKANSSSIGNLTISGLSGSNVTELLTSVKGKLDLKATKLEVSGINGRVSTLEGEIANKLNSNALNDYYNKSHIDATFATKSELSSKVDNNTLTQDYYNKTDVDQKIAQAATGGKVDLTNYYTKGETYSQTQADGKFALISAVNTKANQSSIGDLTGTGLIGSTVTELLKDAKTKIDNINIGNYYNKSETYTKGEVDGKLSAKLDSSTASSTYATKLELAKKADDSKVGLINGRLTTVEGKLANKVENSTLNNYYTKGELDPKFADKANNSIIGTLGNTGLTGSTIEEQLTDVKTKLDAKDLSNYYNKSETYSKSEVNTKLDGKLNSSVYNGEKGTFATKSELTPINEKLSKLEGAIRPVLILTETTSSVEGQTDTQQWLTDKLKSKKGLDPEAGYVITTSDGDVYAYYENKWVLRKTYKVGAVTESTAGIVQSKDEKGHGYIKATSSGDGTMFMVDYQDLKDSIDLKATQTDVTSLTSRVSTVEGELAKKVNSSTLTQDYYTKTDTDGKLRDKLNISTYNSDKATFALKSDLTSKADKSIIGDLQGTGLTGTTVTELLTDAKTKMDSIQAGGIDLSNYYTKGDADGKFALIASLDDKLDASAYNSDKATFATTANLSTLSQKVTTVEGTVSTQGSSISDLSRKLGNLRNTGLTGSTATELFTDVKTRLDGIDLTEYYTKSESDGKYALSTDLSGKLDASTYNSEKTGFAAASAVTTLEGKVRTLESTTSSQGTSIRDLSGKLGNLSGTGLVGTTVTDLLTDAKSKIDAIPVFDDREYYTKSDSDGKFALISSLSGKLDVSTYNSDKTGFATTLSVTTLEGRVDTLEGTSSTHGSSISSLKTKMGSLSGTGLTGTTVTDLLTDAKSKIDAIPVVDTSNYYTKGDADGKFALTSDLASKLDASVYNSEKTGFASSSSVSTLEGKVTTLEGTSATHDSSISSLNTKVGNLKNTGLTGSTVTELLTDTKTRIDGINIGNYYNKSETYTKGEVDGLLSAKLNSSTASSTYATKLELANKADSSLLDAKLDVSTYNSDKSTFATTRSVERLNEKVEKFNNSIRPVLILSEDTSTVEGQSDTQAWLTQKLKTDKQLDPENGLVITTSDGDSYFYFDGQWVLRKTYKVGSVTNSTSGIVLGKDETGHGYIKASDALDGTMVLVDYQDIVDSIGTKAESSTVNGLNTRIGTVEGKLANKVESTTLDAYYPSATVDSLLSAKLNSADAARDYATKSEVAVKANQSSIGDLSGTGLTGSTVTELLADAKTKIDDINISNYYPISETYNRTEINGFLTSKANDSDVVKLTGNQTIAGNKTFTSKVEIDADNEVLKLKNTSNTANYIAGYEGNTRIYYIGKDSSNSNDFSIENETANGWITLKTKSKFDQEYAITDNKQIVHKKYVDDTINTNCVKLTGNQDIAGDKTFSGFSKFTGFVDVDTKPNATYPFMLRFVGDKWSDGQSADLIRFHKYGGVCGYKVHLSGTGFGYAEIWGSTLISNCKDPTDDAHAANKRYVDRKVGTLTSLTTTNKNNVVDAINEVNDNMPVVLPAGTQPTTANIGSMKVAFVLK